MSVNLSSLPAALALAGGLLASGCMTSRGLCTVNAYGDVHRPVTANRYRISHIQQRLPGGQLVDVHVDGDMCEMLNGIFDVKELTSYTPGVWSEDGIPVTVTFCDWQKYGSLHSSVVATILTVGICPYFRHEDITSTVEVTRDDGKGSGRFNYHESDDWKISYLFEFGWIPYSEYVLARNQFQLSGRGDVLTKPHLNGLAHGLASALAEMEANQSLTK